MSVNEQVKISPHYLIIQFLYMKVQYGTLSEVNELAGTLKGFYTSLKIKGLINVIFTLDNYHAIFKDPQSALLSQITKENYKKLLEITIIKSKNKQNRMFKSTFEQRQKRDLIKLKRKLVQQKNQLDVKSFSRKLSWTKYLNQKRNQKKWNNLQTMCLPNQVQKVKIIFRNKENFEQQNNFIILIFKSFFLP